MSSKHGKNYRRVVEKIDSTKEYSLSDAVSLLKENVSGKFDHTMELHLLLGVDPKHSDQVVRGNVILPHGTGRKVRLLVFAKGEAAEAAKRAGADYVGAEDMVEKIQGGWLEFDQVVATPDTMPVVGRVARILGPRGLMPNPKSGTVSADPAGAIRELKAGKVAYRTDKGANVHASIGKLSFEANQLQENAKALIDSIIRSKPPAAKGEYLRRLTLTTTMSPGVPLARGAGITHG